MESVGQQSAGSFIDNDGYVREYAPMHPWNNQGYVHQHRLVMEKYVGFTLEPQIVVHHINLIKTDNYIENLFITTHKEHTAIHNRMRKPTLQQKHKIRKAKIKSQQTKNLADC